MTKVTNLLLALILAVTALYAGTKLYLNHRAETLFDQLSRAVAPAGELSYQNISTSLAGALSYEGVGFRATGQADGITIAAITFETADLFYLLRVLSGGGELRYLPEQLRLNISGLAIDLDGQTMAQLEQHMEALHPDLTSAEALCDEGIAAPTHYRALGYKRLGGDLQIGYRYYESDASLYLDAAVSTPGMARMTLSMNVKELYSLNPQTMMSSTFPYLSKIEMLYEDDGYTARVNHYCAGHQGVSVDGYINSSVNRSDEFYLDHWGFVPGQGLRWAYRTFLTNPGKLHLVMRPPEQFELKNLVHYSPQHIPELLNMTLEVNDQAVPDLTITAIARPGDRLTQPDAKPAPAADERWRAVEPKQRDDKERSVAAYRPIEIGRLAAHLGSKVRLTLESGAIREGYLAAITATELRLEQRLNSGTSSMLVERKDVAAAEVFGNQ